LQRLSESLQKAGRPPILVRAADPNLTDEDTLEMVNAGLIPATVTLSIRANFWAKIFTHLTVHPNIVVKEEGQLAWATRKDSPQLRELLDEFIKSRAVGTAFGNTLVRRYAQSTKWVKDSTSTEEMAKFQAYVRYFQKYATEYNFDYLILIAQGYQESLRDRHEPQHEKSNRLPLPCQRKHRKRRGWQGGAEADYCGFFRMKRVAHGQESIAGGGRQALDCSLEQSEIPVS
jgi:membrane-bound lytic murein transglycosylase MltF